MSGFSATLYPRPDTVFRQSASCRVADHGRVFVRIGIDDLGIQSDCWEDMQLLVDALEVAIARAKQAEQDAALVDVDNSDVVAVAS